ncbi:hypothetical protein PNK_1588 [Candidatus Protochlamydia naegleriophila]|uniref:Uncharacterized protein n=1 Tax=Candidatus Protochlamydia naegleriophila TaxID=389348 RepID=A0A0U5JDL2_9BACT|nr:hypothetical protein PNK_1588 [Candidatus Protochlamydia naegleriophila]
MVLILFLLSYFNYVLSSSDFLFIKWNFTIQNLFFIFKSISDLFDLIVNKRAICHPLFLIDFTR